MRKVIEPDYYSLFISLFLLMMLMPVLAQAETAFQISDERQTELINLLKQDCGSCHGMTLKGGLGPALTPEVIKDKPAQMLVETILLGRPGTPMPPWSPFLTREEAHWLVEQLYQGINDVE